MKPEETLAKIQAGVDALLKAGVALEARIVALEGRISAGKAKAETPKKRGAFSKWFSGEEEEEKEEETEEEEEENGDELEKKEVGE